MFKSCGFTPKKLLTLTLMGFAFATMFNVPFIQYVFYDPMLKALNVTNAQLGTLITIFGLGNILGTPFGGILADKYNHKTLYISAITLTSCLSLIWSFNLSYAFSIMVYIGLSFAALFMFFPSHIKIVRMLGDEKHQGKTFGLADAAIGLGSAGLSTLGLYDYGRFAIDVMGFQGVLISYGIAGLVCAISLFFLVEGAPVVHTDPAKKAAHHDKAEVKDFFALMKTPAPWFAGIAVFCTYTMYCSLSYFTPYFTNVLGISVVFSGALATIRTYGLRCIMGPISGILADKFGSVAKVLLIGWVCAMVTIFFILRMPEGSSAMVAITLTMILSTAVALARGTMFAVPSEVKIPVKYAAMAAGIVGPIGFAPDVFQFAMFGSWLDTYGNDAYRYIFMYNIAVGCLGIANAFMIFRYKRKLAGHEQVEPPVAVAAEL